jgi:hypothetical protein
MCRRHALLAVLLILGAGATGCSRDEAGAFPPRAGAICGRVVRDVRGLPRPPAASPAAHRQLDRVVSLRGAALRELRALRPSASDRGDAERMLRHFEQSQALLRESQRLAGRSERSVGYLISAALESKKGHAIARDLHLGDCAHF